MKRIMKASRGGVPPKDLGLSYAMPVAVEGEGQRRNDTKKQRASISN